MSFARRLLGRQTDPTPTTDLEARSDLSWNDYLSYFNFQGLDYPILTMGGQQVNEPSHDFMGYIAGVYRNNGPVFACMMTRMLLFSEARFQYQQLRNGRPGDLFGTRDLSILENPGGPGASTTTGDMLSRAIQDADIGGNWFARREGDAILRMRPDWVTIIAGSETGTMADARPVGYIYRPQGPHSDDEGEVHLLAEQVAHFAPIPDPQLRFRGMSWITPLIREVMADQAATTHKLKYFENGASPNMVVNVGDGIKNEEAFDRWVAAFKGNHEGVVNHFKTLYLANGADAKVVGSNMEQANLEGLQAVSEARIASAAGIPPVLVGFVKGLDASTYSNYSQSRRRFADGTLRPLWRNFAGSLAPLVPVPGGARLWYDDRDIAFLRDDAKDVADIQSTEASTLHAMIAAGFEPDSAVSFIQSGDFSQLVHTGMYSVQLQPAGTVTQGKGSLVQGVPTPAAPQTPPVGEGTNSMRFIPSVLDKRRPRNGTRAACYTFDVEWSVDWPPVDLEHVRFHPVDGQIVEIRKGDYLPAEHPIVREHDAEFGLEVHEVDGTAVEVSRGSRALHASVDDKAGRALLALLPGKQAD